MTQEKSKEKLFLTRDDLSALGIQYSAGHLIRLEKDELFPKRVYLSPQKVVWLLDEINEWVEQQSARRGGANNG